MPITWTDEAARRISVATRRTEQTPPGDLTYGPRTPHLHRPYHDFVRVDTDPVSGLHLGHICPITLLSGPVPTFVERPDLPVFVFTPDLLNLPVGGTYWGRCADFLEGVGNVSGVLPSYVVDDPYPTTSGGDFSGKPTLPQPVLIEPVVFTPASGITSGGIIALLSGNTYFTLIQSLTQTQLNLLNLTQVGGISLTATQTNNDVLITSVNGCPQYEWSCVSGMDTATQYDPTHSGKPLNQKTLTSGQVQDIYYDPNSGNPVVAIGAGGGFGVGGGIGGGAGGGGGFGGGGGGGAGGGILIFDPGTGTGLKSGTLAYGIVSSSGQTTTTQYGQSGQVTNQKSTTTTYTSDTYYSPGVSGQQTMQTISQSGQWGFSFKYSGGNPANVKTVTAGSGPQCIDTFQDPTNPNNGTQTTVGFGRSGPFLTLGYPPPTGPGYPNPTSPNLTLGFVPTGASGEGNPYQELVIDPASPLTGPAGTALAVTDISGNLVLGIDGSGLLSGSIKPWQLASGVGGGSSGGGEVLYTPEQSYTDGLTKTLNDPTTYQDITTQSVNTQGGNLAIDWSCNVAVSAASVQASFRMLVNSGVIGSDPCIVSKPSDTAAIDAVSCPGLALAVASGTQVVAIQGKESVGGQTASVTAFTLRIMEILKGGT